MFFLARVAEQRGGRFEWCFLPSSGEITWFKGLSVNSVKRFLRTVAFREATASDVALARQVWDDAETGTDESSRPDHADWVIGSGREYSAQDAVATQEPNHLSFVLKPHIKNEPREVEITVRKAFREQAHGLIALADDKKCLSALERPFPAPSHSKKNHREPSQAPRMEGWAPRYLTVLAGNYLVIHLSDGLLVRRLGQYEGETWNWFAPLPADARIAGIDIEKNVLKLVLLRQAGEKHRLAIQLFVLTVRSEEHVGSYISHRVHARDDLLNSRDYALPGIVDHDFHHGGSLDVFGRLGARYRLDRRGNLLQPEVPEILLSTGQHFIIDNSTASMSFLQVMRHRDEELVARYRPALEAMPVRFHDMVWSSDSTKFAYAQSAGAWFALGQSASSEAYADAELPFQTHDGERVLSINIKNNEVHALLWSDARIGGEGTIEAVRYRDGTRVRTTRPIDLGEDADRIVRIAQRNAKLLAIKVGLSGEPKEMISLRYKRPNAHNAREVFDLTAIADEAMLLRVKDAS
ncbi:hypothetical protein [uncultured Erythrobacter sp.]|uniref:hypothetical protein n=1 Tax=uncultured Erythrobacter sp. TaxID=263913 RepID=UPI002633875F|nr:hypothetical protein [uncultured Erythrobacter sp.]